MNKKGAQFTIATIIALVLGLIVLVVVVVGFTSGWSNLWERVTGFTGGGTNVDNIVQACQMACATQAKHDYCERKREVRFEDSAGKLRKKRISCYFLEEMSGKGVLDDEDKTATILLPSVDLSCDIGCPPITLEDVENVRNGNGDEEPPTIVKNCDVWGGTWANNCGVEADGTENKPTQKNSEFVLDASEHSGERCCVAE